eukprot:5859935-Prymnesium_polylepis.1
MRKSHHSSHGKQNWRAHDWSPTSSPMSSSHTELRAASDDASSQWRWRALIAACHSAHRGDLKISYAALRRRNRTEASVAVFTSGWRSRAFRRYACSAGGG